MPACGPAPLDGFCGLYCGACEVPRAVREGRVEEAAKAFGVDPGDVRCEGCRSGDVFVNCKRCGMRKCASSRGFEFCSECWDFPCDEYARLASIGGRLPPHFLITMKNLYEIREKGADEWRRLQVERWTCPSCGAPFSWYAGSCACGRDLRGMKDWELLLEGDTAFFRGGAPAD